VSDIPKLVFRRERRIWWSMVSNAALRSREMTVVDLPESGERRILSKVRRMDVLVESWRRYDDWYWLKLGYDVTGVGCVQEIAVLESLKWSRLEMGL